MPLDVRRFQPEDFIFQAEIETADRATALVGTENLVTKRSVTSPGDRGAHRWTVRNNRRVAHQKFGRESRGGADVLV